MTRQKRSKKNSKQSKIDLSENDSEISPPSYCVVETHDGNLYSSALNVTWPNRPLNGRYSRKFKEQNRRVKFIRAKNREMEKTRKSRDFDEELEMDTDAMTEIQERMKFTRKNDNKFKDWMTFDELEKEMKKKKNVSERKIKSKKCETSDSDDTESISELMSSTLDSSTETDITLLQIPKSDASLTSHFVGIQKAERVFKFLRPTHSILYYKKIEFTLLGTFLWSCH